MMGPLSLLTKSSEFQYCLETTLRTRIILGISVLFRTTFVVYLDHGVVHRLHSTTFFFSESFMLWVQYSLV